MITWTFQNLLWKVAQVACEFMLSLLTLSNSTTFSSLGNPHMLLLSRSRNQNTYLQTTFYSCKECCHSQWAVWLQDAWLVYYWLFSALMSRCQLPSVPSHWSCFTLMLLTNSICAFKWCCYCQIGCNKQACYVNIAMCHFKGRSPQAYSPGRESCVHQSPRRRTCVTPKLHILRHRVGLERWAKPDWKEPLWHYSTATCRCTRFQLLNNNTVNIISSKS